MANKNIENQQFNQTMREMSIFTEKLIMSTIIMGTKIMTDSNILTTFPMIIKLNSLMENILRPLV
jgi:hypothetical protein